MINDIKPLQLPDSCGHAMFLDPENCARFEVTLNKIRTFEDENYIRRTRAPVIMDAPDGPADMVRYKQMAKGQGPAYLVRDEAWRLITDPWKETLELAAKHTMHSYRDLGTLSTLTDVYYRDPGTLAWLAEFRPRLSASVLASDDRAHEACLREYAAYVAGNPHWLQQKTVWIVAHYGPADSTEDAIAYVGEFAETLGAKVSRRVETSGAALRGSGNTEFHPRVTVIEATLLDSAELQTAPVSHTVGA